MMINPVIHVAAIDHGCRPLAAKWPPRALCPLKGYNDRPYSDRVGCFNMKSSPDKLLDAHRELVHSTMQQVVSHVQREAGAWFINTLMIDGCAAPFRYRRKERYRSLQGQRVNLTYYRSSESVAGMSVEVMKVVRVKIA